MPEYYEKLLRDWERDTRFRSDPATEHPSYAMILAGGREAVPALLAAVQERRGWKALLALRALFVDEGPNVNDVAGEFEPICQRWLAWAEERGLLPQQNLVQAYLDLFRASDHVETLLRAVDSEAAREARIKALEKRVEELRSDPG